MNTEIMHTTLQESQAGRITFPEVIGALASAGVESYFADLVRGVDTFYMPDGQTYTEPMKLPPVEIPSKLSHGGITAAIRAAQADEVRYPEFLKRAMASGTAAYWVFIAGRKVVYFGRNGDLHVEAFPVQNQPD